MSAVGVAAVISVRALCGETTPGCQPWGQMPAGTNGADGGGSCGKGNAMDLRFAYGDFNCGANEASRRHVCCGTNQYIKGGWAALQPMGIIPPMANSTGGDPLGNCHSTVWPGRPNSTCGVYDRDIPPLSGSGGAATCTKYNVKASGTSAWWWNAASGQADNFAFMEAAGDAGGNTQLCGDTKLDKLKTALTAAQWTDQRPYADWWKLGVEMVNGINLTADGKIKAGTNFEVIAGVAPKTVSYACPGTPNSGTAFSVTYVQVKAGTEADTPTGNPPEGNCRDTTCPNPTQPASCLTRCGAGYATGWIVQSIDTVAVATCSQTGTGTKHAEVEARHAEAQANDAGPICECSGGTCAQQTGAGVKQECVGYKTHFFCPPVDEFQQFSLKGSARVLSASAASGPCGQLDIIAYGHGRSTPSDDGLGNKIDGAYLAVPTRSMRSRAVVWQWNHPDCGGNPAIASFLLYNVTLRDGKFGYKHKEPIGNGFMSTCEGPAKDQCLFSKGDDTVCLGKEGTTQYNCGKCVTDWAQANTDRGMPNAFMDPYDVNVMVTYYGSDKDGHTLTSGSLNPLNFRQFADADVYEDVYSKAKGKAEGFHFPW